MRDCMAKLFKYIEKDGEKESGRAEIWKFMRGLLGFYGSLRG